MVGSGGEKNEKKETFRQKLKFYVTFAAASIGKKQLLDIHINNLRHEGICTFSLFLFLIPFVIDPALATINHDFVKTPVQCKVILNKYILGTNSSSINPNNKSYKTILISAPYIF